MARVTAPLAKGRWYKGIYWRGTIDQMRVAGFEFAPFPNRKSFPWMLTHALGRPVGEFPAEKVKACVCSGGRVIVHMTDEQIAFAVRQDSEFADFMASALSPVETDGARSERTLARARGGMMADVLAFKPALQLVPPVPEPETVAVLRAALCRAERRRTHGALLILRSDDGNDEYFWTGAYVDRPAEAVRAALKATMLLTDMEGRPSHGRRGPRS